MEIVITFDQRFHKFAKNNERAAGVQKHEGFLQDGQRVVLGRNNQAENKLITNH